MFSGIIEEKGMIVGKKISGQVATVSIRGEKIFEDLSPGDSISVDGVCLTVEKIHFPVFSVTVSSETMRLTTLGSILPGTQVNLERALKYGDRVGGHLLSGHIDFKTKISGKTDAGKSTVLKIKIPPDYRKFFVPKCSVGIDGISLTVADIKGDEILIWLIPYTIENTTMSNKKTGDYVNVEIDIVVKSIIERNVVSGERHDKINKEAIF